VHALFNDTMLSRKYRKGNYALTAVVMAYLKRIRQMVNRQHFDLVWIEKEALPWLPISVERTLLVGVPYILDYDDALFHNYDLHSSFFVRRFLGHRIDELIRKAHLVMCGNDYLAKRARDAGAAWVEILPTAIDLERYPSRRPVVNRSEEVKKIVWIGTPSTGQYLKLIYRPLRMLNERYRFKLRVIGARLELSGLDVEYVDWSEATEVSSIQACDIGVMPLEDLPWERGKCGYKLIQYMACNLPVVASPVGINKMIVKDNINGFLVQTDKEWFSALETLLNDDDLRWRMGALGRETVEDEFCVQKTAPRLIKYLTGTGER
jgi:glycosyltransferase involved in cell wall biosynthesis